MDKTSCNNPKVSVVILSYARPAYLGRVLESVLTQTYTNLEIILVDNCSNESDHIASIAAQFPAVRLISNAENLGFADGMNQGVRESSGEYTFLTEDDIVLDSHCVERFVSHSLLCQTTAILSGIQYNRTSGTIRCAGATLQLTPFFRKNLLMQGKEDDGTLVQPYETDFVPGSMIFAKTKLLRELGPFRSDFFMYFEDTELCLRIRRRGARIVIVPSAKAWHFEPDDKPSSDTIDFHRIKNFFALYILHAPFRILPEFALRYLVVPLFQSVIRDQRRFLLLLRAALHSLRKIGRMLADRKRESAVAKQCNLRAATSFAPARN